MNLRSHPLLVGLMFQAALIPLAFFLAAIAGVPLGEHLHWDPNHALIGVIAVLPMLAMLGLIAHFGGSAYDTLSGQVRDFIARLFGSAWPGAILLISLLAGLGEELLVRGVLQTWLDTHLPAFLAILIAAVVFGLAHAITRLYFVFATAIGLYLGLVYYLTGNLLVVIITHALYDWIVIHWYRRKL
ncbi:MULTISPECIES: CPBP family intramembrane glutamic endopeptidase [unclassified Thioalkalivibrio]|uniref:CPBP family intramembrane glutamic endopeptidase n=1 Tax=unclassified Thioalkalivibrio TaxID=2621013 RepID=UPI000399BB6F|nr:MULTISPECIES: type II CAAX endopeptidase family protein [unclassified Thioalkalivibrio]